MVRVIINIGSRKNRFKVAGLAIGKERGTVKNGVSRFVLLQNGEIFLNGVSEGRHLGMKVKNQGNAVSSRFGSGGEKILEGSLISFGYLGLDEGDRVTAVNKVSHESAYIGGVFSFIRTDTFNAKALTIDNRFLETKGMRAMEIKIRVIISGFKVN